MFFIEFDQPGIVHLLIRKPFGFQVLSKIIRIDIRKAHAIGIDGLIRVASLMQIIQPFFSVFRLGEQIMKVGSGHAVGFLQASLFSHVAFFLLTHLPLRELIAAALCQGTHGLRKGHVLIFLHKGEDRTRRMTAEAIIHLIAALHVERG